jgi:hypothetical protein
MKQRLAKERRQERKRQEEGIFCLCFVHFFLVYCFTFTHVYTVFGYILEGIY